jgi:hypothetical protein
MQKVELVHETSERALSVVSAFGIGTTFHELPFQDSTMFWGFAVAVDVGK